MREGVLQKLSEQHIKRFPTTENKSTGALSSIVVFESCYCEKKQMAEFGSCRKWFHRMCEPITGEIFENETAWVVHLVEKNVFSIQILTITNLEQLNN